MPQFYQTGLILNLLDFLLEAILPLHIPKMLGVGNVVNYVITGPPAALQAADVHMRDPETKYVLIVHVFTEVSSPLPPGAGVGAWWGS